MQLLPHIDVQCYWHVHVVTCAYVHVRTNFCFHVLQHTRSYLLSVEIYVDPDLDLEYFFKSFIQLANDIKMKTKQKHEICWAAGEHKRALSPEGAVLPTQQNSTNNNNKRKVNTANQKCYNYKKWQKLNIIFHEKCFQPRFESGFV